MRLITLAKFGFVAFSHDMVGYADSKRQIAHSIAGEDNELWGTSPMKLQLWNAIRGVDFLQSLPDVDPEKIAHGGIGGGTQTFMLMAVDDRIKVAAPAWAISTGIGRVAASARTRRSSASIRSIRRLPR
ncbi:MAG: dienelactone hydrolase family protein [Desulfobacterales bacterium]|nr:dienelactone hydrolase family protein [Desulfobacterales bacterium]